MKNLISVQLLALAGMLTFSSKRHNDGTYVPASEERHREVEGVNQIYSEVFKRVFSGDLSMDEADKAVEEARRRVRELLE